MLVKESGGCAQQLADFILLLKQEAVGERGDQSKVDFWRPLVAKLAPSYRDKLGKAGEKDSFFHQFMEIAERVPLMHVYSALEEKRNSFESMLLNSFVSAYQRTANEDKRVRELQMLVKRLSEVTFLKRSRGPGAAGSGALVLTARADHRQTLVFEHIHN